MKIGIIGTAERAVAWEKNMGQHPSVSEVIITRSLDDLGTADACVIIDESDTNLDTLMEAVKAGYHCFLVSRLPRKLPNIEKIYHASEESNVAVQFSHWPSLAPASQWMIQKIQKPHFIQIIREIGHTDFLERDNIPSYYWIDELAFCIKWMKGAIHQVDVNQTKQAGRLGGATHIFLRFESGSTANIFVNTASHRNNHIRMASDASYILDCDILEQKGRIGKVSDGDRLFFQKKLFDASRSAELASSQFLKAIQLNRPTPFGAYDLYRTLKVVDKIGKKLTL
ncbi:hypothetical protein [Halalkalibaculum sp. DA384]|uniref:hypothetical protein n=1 Tax=Halalkalibaculum sp. DA384 TaxID=3373606 RepID=UPI0037546DD7